MQATPIHLIEQLQAVTGLAQQAGDIVMRWFLGESLSSGIFVAPDELPRPALCFLVSFARRAPGLCG